jgi:adenylate cyclase
VVSGVFRWLLPLALLILPLGILGNETAIIRSQSEDDLKNQWREKFQSRSQGLLRLSEISAWGTQTGQDLKRSLRRAGRELLTPEGFARALEHALRNDLPRGLDPCLAWGFSLNSSAGLSSDSSSGSPSGSPSDSSSGSPSGLSSGSPSGLSSSLLPSTLCYRPSLESGIEKRLPRVFDGLAGQTAPPPGLSPDQLNLLKRGFGPTVTAEFFQPEFRGKPFHVAFRGGYYLMLWDLVPWRNRWVGGYFLLIPITRSPATLALRLYLRNQPGRQIQTYFVPLPHLRQDGANMIGKNPGPDFAEIRPVLAALQNRQFLLPASEAPGDRSRIHLATREFNEIHESAGGRFWIWFAPLNPLTGRCAALVTPRPTVAPSFLEQVLILLRGTAFMAILLVLLFRAGFGEFPRLSIQAELWLWIIGIAAIPLALCIGAGYRLHADLLFHGRMERRQVLKQAISQVEASVAALEKSLDRELNELFRRRRFFTKLSEMQRYPDQFDRRITDLEEAVQTISIRPFAMVILGHKKWFIPRYFSAVDRSLKYILTALFTNMADRFIREFPCPPELQQIADPPPPARYPQKTLPFEPPALAFRVMMRDLFVPLKAGRKNFLLGRKAFWHGKNIHFIVLLMWDMGKHTGALLPQSIKKAEHAFRDQGIFLSAFSTAGNALREIGDAQDDRHGYRNLAGVAKRAQLAPVLLNREHAREMVYAGTSALLPETILAGTISLDSLYQELREFEHQMYLSLGLIALLIGLLGKGLVFLLCRPIMEFQSTLSQVTLGNLQCRVTATGNDELGFAGQSLNSMIGWLEERHKLSRFVPPQVLELLGRHDLQQVMDGEEQDVAVLVSDIRSFTTLTETHPPPLLFAALNRHLEIMTREIETHEGQVYRFIGDAIQAVFYGVQRSSAAVKAVRAALAMRRAHTALNDRRRARGEFTYEIGFGIAEGRVVCGLMGSPDVRMDLTMLGEPMVRAGELEALSKNGTATKIMVSTDVAGHTAAECCFQPGPVPEVQEVIATRLPPTEVLHQANITPLESPPAADLHSPDNGRVSTSPARAHALDSSPTLAPPVAPFRTFSLFPIALVFLIPLLLQWLGLQQWETLIIQRGNQRHRLLLQETGTMFTKTVSARLEAEKRIRLWVQSLQTQGSPYSLVQRVAKTHQEITRGIPGTRLFLLAPPGPGPSGHSSSLRRYAFGKKMSGGGFEPTEWYELYTSLLAHAVSPSIINSRAEHAAMMHFPLSADEAREMRKRLLEMHGPGRPFPDLFGGTQYGIFCLVKNRTLARLSTYLGAFNGTESSFMGIFRNTHASLLAISMKGQSNYLYWQPIRGTTGRLDTLVILFVPPEALADKFTPRYALHNLRKNGFEFSVWSETPEKQLYATPGLRDPAVVQERMVLPGWKNRYVWVGKRPTYEYSGFREMQFFARALFVLWLAFLALVLFSSRWKAALERIPVQIRLLSAFGWLLLVTIPTGISFLERTHFEHMNRSIIDAGKAMQTRMQNLQTGRNLYLSEIGEAFRRVFRLVYPTVFPNVNVPATNQRLRQVFLLLNRRGFIPDNISLTMLDQFFCAPENFRKRWEVFVPLHENVLRRFPQPGQDNEKRAFSKKEFLAEEGESLLLTLFPPEVTAAWRAAPQSITLLEKEKSEENLFFFNHHIFRRGSPMLIGQSYFYSAAFLPHLFLEWEPDETDERESYSRLILLNHAYPSMRLRPPFSTGIFDRMYSSHFNRLPNFSTRREEEIWSLTEPRFAEISDKVWATGETMFFQMPLQGREHLLAASPIRPEGYTAILAQPLSEIQAPISATRQQGRGLLLLEALLALLLAVFISRRFLQPVQRLIVATESIIKHRFTTRLIEDSRNEFGDLARTFNQVAKGLEEGKFLAGFVSDSVRAAVADASVETAISQGEHQQAVIMFASIAGMKDRLSHQDPHALVRDVNAFLESMAVIIRGKGGDIDKFMGEKILAVFAPKRFGSLEVACEAAFEAGELMKQRFARLSAWQQETLGIGLVAGPVLVGILGAQNLRSELTVIGDSVNLASRLCDLSMKSGGGMVLSASCVEGLVEGPNWNTDRQKTLVHLGEIAVKGKEQKIIAYRHQASRIASDDRQRT